MARVVKLEDNVDLPMKKGDEDVARKYYGRILGLRETMKAPGERGVWFQIGDTQLRLRAGDAAPEYSDAVKAFLEVDNAESYRRALQQARYRVWDAPSITGTRGVVTADPFGNRLELREYKPGHEGARERVREEVMGLDAEE
jgi:catechol 2,3-dioxygenase-like lactoylglutathione lyase family enzyme